jgi:peptidase E
MSADRPTILATSGGWRRGQWTALEFGGLIHHAIELSGATGRPRLCHVGTADGDQRSTSAMVSEAGRVAGVDVSHLNLFPMPPTADLADFVLGHDVIWVNGGSVANLLAVWQVHGIGEIMRAAWQAGVVLAGVSAGSICWYTGGVTDSFGPELRVVTNGLGLLPYASGVHMDSEAARRPTIHAAVATGKLPETHCTDDGTGLLYRGTTLVEALSERKTGGAYLVRLDESTGEVVETPMEPRRL